jgi:hypothetical protein
MQITKSGIATESVGDGCCDPVIEVKYRVSDVHRSGETWTAQTVVTAVKVHPGWSEGGQPAPRVGQTSILTLNNGVVVSTLTGANYCSDKADLTGVCGA